MVLITPLKKIHIDKNKAFGGVVIPTSVTWGYTATSLTYDIRTVSGSQNMTMAFGDATSSTVNAGAISGTKTYPDATNKNVEFTCDDYDNIRQFFITGSAQQMGGLAGIELLTSVQTLLLRALMKDGNLKVKSTNLKDFECYSGGMTTVDMTGATFTGTGDFRLDGCGQMTSFTAPDSFTSQPAVIRFNDCNSLTTLNLTNFGNYFGGTCRLNTCASLESVTMPSSTANFTNLYIYSCPNLVSLDVSDLTGLSGEFSFYGCTNLTTLVLPSVLASEPVFTKFYFFNNTGLSTVDTSGLLNLGGALLGYSCGLSSFTFPASAKVFTNIQLYNNSLTSLDFTPLVGANDGVSIVISINSFDAANVNQILVDLDTKGWINGSVNISGAGNSAPDGTSGGLDGLTAKTNLIANGWTVTTN